MSGNKLQLSDVPRKTMALLLALTTALKEQVDESNKDVLSLDMVKKAEQIEKLAGNLDTVTKMLLKCSDQGASAHGIPGAGTAQVALELAACDEVRERLLGEHGREPVGHPFRGQKRSHERAW